MNQLDLVVRTVEAAAGAHTARALAMRVAEAMSAALPIDAVGVKTDDASWLIDANAAEVRGPESSLLKNVAMAVEVDGLALECFSAAPSVLDARTKAALVRALSAVLEKGVVVRRLARTSRRAFAQNRSLKEDLADERDDSIVAKSEAMRTVVARAQAVAPYDSTVLITGESGSGKEVLARRIHQRSIRSRRPFVAMNCGAIPEHLLESTLFGHARGAFTGASRDHAGLFQRAAGGTLLLDEVGELTKKAQTGLLRVVQERRFVPVGGEAEVEVNVRILCATHRRLLDLVERREFREDLYYRIAVFEIEVPPLRDRIEDLPALIDQLLVEICGRMRRTVPKVSKAITARLAEHRWPGNVRELANVLEGGLITSGTRLELPATFSPRVSTVQEIQPLDQTIADAIASALHATGGKIYGPDGAAALLDLKPPTLQSKMRKLGLERDRFIGPKSS